MEKEKGLLLRKSDEKIEDIIEQLSTGKNGPIINFIKEMMEKKDFVVSIQGKGVFVDEQCNVEITSPMIKFEFQ